MDKIYGMFITRWVQLCHQFIGSYTEKTTEMKEMKEATIILEKKNKAKRSGDSSAWQDKAD